MAYKPLPDNPSLEFDKKQAKALLKACRSGDDDAYARVRAYHPRLLNASDDVIRAYQFTLSDAQLVIAREYGFPSWTKLKAQIQSLTDSLEPEIAQFKSAISNHDVAKARDLLKRHKIVRESINDPLFSFGSVALTEAKYNLEMIDLLIEYGADVNAKSSWWAGGFHVLHHVEPTVADYLIERGAEVDIHSAAEYDKFDRLKQLIKADPNLVNALGGDGKTPLHYASSVRVMAYLLEHGANINQRDIDHNSTPLQWAVEDESKCRFLIEHGADIDIFVACRLGDIALVDRALDDYPTAVEARTNRDGYPPAPRAMGGHIYLYNLGDNRSPHQIARKYGHTAVYDYLIQRSSPKARFLDACERADEVTARKILDQHPDIMAQLSNDDKQILPASAWDNDVHAVRVLLNLGFDPHINGDDKSTALDRASFHGFADIVKLLLARDSNPLLDHKNTYGGTQLGTAIYGIKHSWRDDGDHYATIEALIKAGAKYDESWLPTGDDAVDKLLHQHLTSDKTSIQMSNTDDLFMQAIHAVINGDADTLKSLFKQHPELVTMRSPANHKATLLFYVTANGVEDELQKSPPNAVAIAQILLSAGADVNATMLAYGGETTALSLLVSSSHPAHAGVQGDLAKLFVESGAPVNGVNDDGIPLSTALLFNYLDTAKVLVECGARVDNVILSAGLGDLEKTKSFFDVEGKLIENTLGTYTDPFGRTPQTTQDILNMGFWYALTNDQHETGNILIEHGANMDYAPIRNETQLHWAGWYNNRANAEFLIKHNADVSIRDERHNATPAGWAHKNGHTDLRDYLAKHYDISFTDAVKFRYVDMVKSALQQNTTIANGEDGKGMPLRTASHHGYTEIVKLLLEHGADVTLKNKDGKTALTYALEQQHKQIETLLRQHGATE